MCFLSFVAPGLFFAIFIILISRLYIPPIFFFLLKSDFIYTGPFHDFGKDTCSDWLRSKKDNYRKIDDTISDLLWHIS
jgi:hypothetical protein